MDDELLRALGRNQRDELDPPTDDGELLQPFDDAAREAMLDAVFQDETRAAANDVRPGAAVINLASRRAAVIGVLLAVAASVAILVWWSGDRSPTARDKAVA